VVAGKYSLLHLLLSLPIVFFHPRFFHNKGAVAGVFTVVGLIAFAILIALITNGIRRRRAKKFDDDVAAAAHDAANTQVPNFGYEDEFQPGGGASYGTSNGAKYSDISHGTYTQPPMTIPESYGMRELPHGPGPAPGEYLDPGRLGYGVDAAAAGAAGIGVARARSMRDGSYAAGLQEGASPYVAFAYPSTRNNPENGPQYPPGMIRGTGGPEFDLQRRPSQYTQQSGSDYSSTVFSKTKSLTGTLPTSTHSHHSHSVPNNTGVDEYQGYPSSFRMYGNKVATYSDGVTGGDSHLPPIPSEENLNSAYDGYVADESNQPKNPHQANRTHPVHDQLPNPFSNDQYDDETDEDEVEQPKRILKVGLISRPTSFVRRLISVIGCERVNKCRSSILRLYSLTRVSQIHLLDRI